MVNIWEAKSIKKAYFIIVKKLDNAHYVVKDPEIKVKYIASRTKDYYYVIGCEYKDKR